MDLSLLQWLETHAFPVESRFKDTAFARKVYCIQVVRDRTVIDFVYDFAWTT